MVESIICSTSGRHPLFVVIYLDDIAVYGNIQEQVLADMLQVVKKLAIARFIFNLHKS